MKNKGFVIALTVIITLLCIYYLSFTIISRSVVSKAEVYATDANKVVNLGKKQRYIDSVWNKPVYDLFGMEFTYKQIKDNELNLGLDLQGGMHVTLEVSPADIIKGMVGTAQDSSFTKAINTAIKEQKTSKKNLSALFFESYKKQNPNRNFSSIFTSATTRDRIKTNTSDADVVKVVNEEIDRAIDRSYIIIRNRLDQFGTSSPNIQKLPGTGRIQVEIPGADNPQRVRKLLQGVARLEFWDVADRASLDESFLRINSYLLSEKARAKSLGTPDTTTTTEKQPADSLTELESQLAQRETEKNPDSLSTVSELFSLSIPQGAFRYDLKDTAAIKAIFRKPEVRAMLPSTVGVYWGNKPDKAYGNEQEALQLYFLDITRAGKAKLTGEVITSARPDIDQYGRQAVSMTMNAAGTRTWAKMTASASAKSPQGQIAIVLDNTVYSAPSVNGEIPNGNSQISGNFTSEEAKDLASILQAGSLPAPARIVEEAIIGPTLGQSAQQEGIISSFCGLILVVIFMVAYYARGGWIANIALLFNIFFILGILAQPSLGTALTLPGIAGIVLTMGMAVDANVLIYERIKEEMLNGVRLQDAIGKGFERAFASIFDSNLTALITGVFLYIFGQGPIKGFAITLIIGIVTSFFTAIYISRVLIEWMARRGDAASISFETGISKLIRSRKYYEFVSKSKKVYLISSIVVLIGFVLLIVNGLNLGVDFKGGRSFTVSFQQPVVATDMKVSLTDSFEQAGTEVKNYGGNNVMKVITSYLVDDDSEQADEKVRAALIQGVEKFSGLKYAPEGTPLNDTNFTISSSTKVVATVADDIKNSAWQASLFSLLGIFFYILIRFHKWQYSLGAIVATIHDALFVIAAFAIVDAFGISFEIDQIFVAALLTVIGYSINDTVIIFDRIREKLGLTNVKDKSKLVNDAINETLSRTIITSGTTLIVVLVLLIFGGEVLRGFSFALLIGVIVGTYSSIFIAGPTVLGFNSKAAEIKQ